LPEQGQTLPVTRYLLLLAVGIASALADVAYSFEQRTTPRPLRIHVVRVELDSKQHTLDVIVAPDPDGPGPAEARLEKPGVLASQPDIVAAINANAFEEYPPPPRGTRSHWRVGLPVRILGWAKNAGREASFPQPGYWNFWLDEAGAPHIGHLTNAVPARLAVAGFEPLLLDGRILPGEDGVRHPRTAVGLDATRQRLLLVVVDGRRPGYSEGVSTRELASLLAEMGAHQALNLDGGGSSILFFRQDGTLRMVNRPAQSGARPVPVLLVVRQQKPQPSALPAAR
jgi:hypothetical protein